MHLPPPPCRSSHPLPMHTPHQYTGPLQTLPSSLTTTLAPARHSPMLPPDYSAAPFPDSTPLRPIRPRLRRAHHRYPAYPDAAATARSYSRRAPHYHAREHAVSSRPFPRRPFLLQRSRSHACRTDPRTNTFTYAYPARYQNTET